jgi:signal transduction histidine kinase
VHLSCREDGPKWVCLTLRDFAPGVAEAELKRIFRPFYRGSAASGAVKSTGIGHALIARLAAAMGGAVAARNRNPGLALSIRPATVQDSRQ